MSDPRKRAILEAAFRIFEKHGPAKTTVAGIARAADVAVGTIYLEFRSKDALLGALSTRAHSRVLESERAALQSEGSAVERLRGALDARTEGFVAIASQARHGRELLLCSRCDAITRAHHAFRKRERKLFQEHIDAARDVGELRSVSAATLLDAYSRFAPPLLNPREDWRARLDSLHALVLRGVSVGSVE